MIKSLIFDFGGTIDLDGIHWSEKFWEVYDHYSIPVSKDDFRNAFVYSERIVIWKINKEDSFRETLKKQVHYQFEYLTENNILRNKGLQKIKNKIVTRCYSDVLSNIKMVLPLLEELKKKYSMGLVSNFYGNIDTVLNELSIYELFDTVIDSADAGIRKPDPKIFELVLSELNISPSESIVIGDSYDRDIVPAKLLGISTVWLNGKSWRKQSDTSKADVEINSLIELKAVLAKKKILIDI